MRVMKKMILAVCLISIFNIVVAGEVSIEMTSFTQGSGSWRVDVTLKHADSGWDHYANEWRIVDENGKLLGRRVLAHPHVEEQPFTRSLFRANIPAQVGVVFIEARDSVHGWSKDRVRVDLSRTSGDRFRVRRN